MTGARAQFGRRPAAPPAVVHAAAVDAPPPLRAAAAGRAQARQRVSAPGRGLRGRLAVPVVAFGVVALTWVDAGVLRAEDAPSRPDVVEATPWSGAWPAYDNVRVGLLSAPVVVGEADDATDDARAPDAVESDEED